MHKAIVVAVLLVGSACAPAARESAAPSERGDPSTAAVVSDGQPGGAAASPAPPPAKPVDPREGGLEVGFGEFAVTLEASVIRPGPVTFVVRNGGALVHQFEIEAEDGGSNRGPGGGDDGFEIESREFGPGETVEIRADLAPGVYEVQCSVGDHDDIGMSTLLRVEPDAPLVTQKEQAADRVSIEGFGFQPATLDVAAGMEVTWVNDDPTPHTVTAEDGSFDSGTLERGGTFRAVFTSRGSFAYLCEIHPAMRGTIRVR